MTDIVKEALKTIPELEIILKESTKDLKKMSANQVMNEFEELLLKHEEKAFEIYKYYESKALDKLIDLWLTSNKNRIEIAINKKGINGIKDILSDFAKHVREFEFHASQMRKARGGKAFELLTKILLNAAGVPCEEPHRETREILRRIDLVSPNAETARLTPDKSIFIAVKRTLRERWKQIVPEHMKGARLYLITIDDYLTEKKADEIKETGMVVYVRSELKEKEHLKEKPWVRKIKDLPKEILEMMPNKSNED